MTDTRTSPSGPQVQIPDATPRGFVLQGTRYIDARDTGEIPQIPESEQDGSITFPFSTCAAAVSSVTSSTELARPFQFVFSAGARLDSAGALDLTGFLDVTVEAMGSIGTPQVGQLALLGTENLARLRLRNINAADANLINTGFIELIGKGQHNDHNATSIYLAGDYPINQGGGSGFDLRVDDCTALDLSGYNAEVDGGTFRTLALKSCQLRGSITCSGVGAFEHQLRDMEDDNGALTLTVDATNTFFIDAWTNSTAVSMGPAELAPATVTVI